MKRFIGIIVFSLVTVLAATTQELQAKIIINNSKVRATDVSVFEN